MKISKILVGAVAAVAMVGFFGCATNEDEHNIISVKGDTASVNYTNEGTVTYRGFRTLKTKHTDAVAVFTLGGTETEDTSARTGVMGFVFDLEKDKSVKNSSNETKKHIYDFTAVSLRKNGSAIQAYISRFEGVDADNMDGDNNFKDADGKELTTTASVLGAKETEILKGTSGAYATLNGVTKNDDGTYTVAVEVIANTDGTYSVKFYDGKDAVAESAKDEDGVKTGQIKSGAKELTITGNKTSQPITVDASWKEGATKTKQTDMGFYAAVYPGKTLVASLQLPYILNEDEVIEWED